MRNSIIGENDCKRAISHETNPSPIKWWFWKGNCLARVMDSVSAVMTHVTRESWDPGPGPYRQSKAAAQPHWELPQDVLWMAKGWPIAPPPPKGCRAEHRVSREPFHLAWNALLPPLPPPHFLSPRKVWFCGPNMVIVVAHSLMVPCITFYHLVCVFSSPGL